MRRQIKIDDPYLFFHNYKVLADLHNFGKNQIFLTTGSWSKSQKNKDDAIAIFVIKAWRSSSSAGKPAPDWDKTSIEENIWIDQVRKKI